MSQVMSPSPQYYRVMRNNNDATMSEALKLRELASWYREFAEQAGNPMIWDARLRTAENLEAEAALLEHRPHPTGKTALHRAP